MDIHFAQESSEYAATIGIAEGTRMEVIGFVTHNPAGPGSFHLARFYVSCCAADAIPYAVAVDAGERDFPDDTWLGISGALARQDERWVLVAERVRLEQEPKDPYLY